MNIITLTLSPAYDVHCEAEEIKIEKENIAKIIRTDVGGKGINISRALLSAGVGSVAVVVLGQDNSDNFIRGLESDGISYVPIITDGRIRENITVRAASGKETRISFTGNCKDTEIMKKVENTVLPLCNRDTVLTLTGRLPDCVDIGDVKRFLERIRALRCRVIIDSRSFSLSDLADVKPFLIKPNEEEIASYIGREIFDADEGLKAARKLRALGIENVMISLGARGAVLESRDESLFVEAPKISPVSTIGAGDSSIAGFLAALIEGGSMRECLCRAVAFGCASCLTEGTLPPRKADIDSLLGKIK
jgi:1-phosphofructokinase family hexose kinase